MVFSNLAFRPCLSPDAGGSSGGGRILVSPEMREQEIRAKFAQDVPETNNPEVLGEKFIVRFIEKVNKIAKNPERTIEESKCTPIQMQRGCNDVVAYRDLDINRYSNRGFQAFEEGEVAVIMLNAGLSTTMGLTKKAKSLLELQGVRIIDYKLGQVGRLLSGLRVGARIPHTSLNSRETAAEAQAAYALGGLNNPNGISNSLIQYPALRLLKGSLRPFRSTCGESGLAPQGHGEIFEIMYRTGYLKQLLDSGVKCIFISNSDNMGATIDPAACGYFLDEGLSFMAEVVEKTDLDVKGGNFVIVDPKEVGIDSEYDRVKILREPPMCHPGEEAQFRNRKKHPYFNTNNLYVSVEELFKALDKNGGKLDLFLMTNNKTASDGTEFTQIECPAGGAISAFPSDKTRLLEVDRLKRFWPMKGTPELLAMASDRFVFDQYGDLVLADDVALRGPLPVTFDKIGGNPSPYNKSAGYDVLTQNGANIPSLRQCTSLTIGGNSTVIFGKNLVFVGDVHINNPYNTEVIIPDNTVIQGDYICGR